MYATSSWLLHCKEATQVVWTCNLAVKMEQLYCCTMIDVEIIHSLIDIKCTLAILIMLALMHVIKLHIELIVVSHLGTFMQHLPLSFYFMRSQILAQHNWRVQIAIQFPMGISSLNLKSSFSIKTNNQLTIEILKGPIAWFWRTGLLYHITQLLYKNFWGSSYLYHYNCYTKGTFVIITSVTTIM